MASEEHQKLASFIKSTHQKLREESNQLGFDEGWRRHCSHQDVLKKYAEAMRELATNYWDRNNNGDPTVCRISWILEKSEDYFVKGGLEEESDKEEVRSRRLQGDVGMRSRSEPLGMPTLLDVGSCYNPFKQRRGPYSGGVTAVDLAPASDDVLQCDILSVPIGSSLTFTRSNNVLTLPEEGYHAVVLSLVLEYIPTAPQRWVCIEKCYRVLKRGGVLFIITPDSKHATANAKTIRRWRIGLAQIGLWRIAHDKLRHLHCMAFRKCYDPHVPRLRFPLYDEHPEKLLTIPQDSSDFQISDESHSLFSPISDWDRDEIAHNFEDMPANYDYFI